MAAKPTNNESCCGCNRDPSVNPKCVYFCEGDVHVYCRGCFKNLVEIAISTKPFNPVSCCGNDFDNEMVQDHDPNLFNIYYRLGKELGLDKFQRPPGHTASRVRELRDSRAASLKAVVSTAEKES